MKKRLLILGWLTISIQSVMAQTFVTDTLKQPAMSGDYYNNSKIILGPGFGTLTGGKFKAYILPPGCRPLEANPSKVNYIITYTPRQPFTTADDLNSKLSCEVMENISYFDGLGRPLQNIQVKGSSMADKDVVQPFEYDSYGREKIRYSPYAATTNNGSYKTDAITVPNGIYSFYSPAGITVGTEMSNGITATQKPFAETKFEPSPLNRGVEQGATGEAWQLSQGHTIKLDYPNNLANEVRRYNAVYVSGTASYKRALSPAGYYPANELLKTITKDENWTGTDGRVGTEQEYRDKERKILLKRTFNLTGGQLDSLSTYYVYDENNNLSYVLPPGVRPDETYIINQSDLDTWCYQYRYDERNRLIEKKMPGKGWEFLVYNKADQLVLSQDSVQRSHNSQDWGVMKYDRFGRVVITGIFKQPNSIAGAPYRMLMQDSVNATQHYPNPRWENRTPNGNGYINSSGTYNVFPYHLNMVLSINFFDNYNIPNTPTAYIAPPDASTMTQGLLTANITSVLREDNSQGELLWTMLYYDDKGRSIKSYHQHFLNGILSPNNYDELLNTYDFSNEVVSTTRLHHTATASGEVTLTVNNSYSYDQLGRKTHAFEQINKEPVVLLSKIEYNEIGQLLAKSVGDNLQTVRYAYNEHGWMTKDSAALFNMRLRYNAPAGIVQPQYNGNISQSDYLTTKVTNPGNRSFNYSYDKLNRLKQAAFTGGIAGDALDEQLTYDVMGNIQTLNRGGTLAGNLNYVYNGNQLTAVAGYSPRNYLYDGNGNAISDKTGSSLSYNLLNLPQKLSINEVIKATYTYNSAGNKLRNTGTDGTWDYISGIVYHNGAIKFVNTNEGRAIYGAGVYNYSYDLKDHLGNTRVSIDRFNNAARIVQEDEYYSFGLRKPTGQYNLSNNNRYLYNGKELQVDLENRYDYGARFYDAVIGRWTSMDLSAEKAGNWTPYRYGFNNPIRFIDPKGAYETDGHFWTVYLMTTMMGLNSSDAFQIAYYTEAPDNIMNRQGDVLSSPSTWLNPISQYNVHMLTGGSSASARKMTATAVRNSSDWEDLGTKLHSLGDSYAHTSKDDPKTMYWQFFGHLFYWHEPDKIANRPSLYKEYVKNLVVALGDRIGYKGRFDTFTFDYIASSGGSTEQNSAILETEVRLRQGGKLAFTVDGKQADAINDYFKKRNEYFGSSVKPIITTRTITQYVHSGHEFVTQDVSITTIRFE